MTKSLAALSDEQLRSALGTCGLADGVTEAVLAHGPFDDDAALRDAIDRAVLAMSDNELDAAIRAEPAPDNVVGDADALEAARVALRLYESRFGYPYLSSIDTPTAEELLMRVRIRLGNEPEPESRAAREHFRRIVRQRLEQLTSATS